MNKMLFLFNFHDGLNKYDRLHHKNYTKLSYQNGKNTGMSRWCSNYSSEKNLVKCVPILDCEDLVTRIPNHQNIRIFSSPPSLISLKILYL